MRACLHLDIGNTALKWQIVNQDINQVLILDFAINILPKLNKNDDVFIATVSHKNILENILTYYQHCKIHIVKTSQSYKKLSNAYIKTQDLGVDRWLGLISVYEQYPKTDVLLLGCGTATTLDILDANGKHQGGIIMPSLALIRPTLAKFLPKDKQIYKPSMSLNQLADNTYDAWQFGCESLWVNGVLASIDRILIGDTKLVITGGYASILLPFLNKSYHLKENLVLSGLKYWALNE